MWYTRLSGIVVYILVFILVVLESNAQRQMENLGRGVVRSIRERKGIYQAGDCWELIRMRLPLICIAPLAMRKRSNSTGNPSPVHEFCG